METIDLLNWDSFEPELLKLRELLTKNASNNKCPELLFRGHSSSQWSLTTTLERAGCERMSFEKYYERAVARVRPAVETFTGAKWDVADYTVELEASFRNDRELFFHRLFPSVELYRYLVYLRHHGFPSPLLDWTTSANIAAFFAFRDEGPNEARSVYVYCERPHVIKGGTVGEPAMRAIGRYVRSHPRHFRQQSNYTMCANFELNSGWHFHPHEPVFGNRGRQDFLWKFNIPSSERIRVLRRLDSYNLNAFSLFDSEEALLETMWLREHVLCNPD
jgi:hypothetical protein